MTYGPGPSAKKREGCGSRCGLSFPRSPTEPDPKGVGGTVSMPVPALPHRARLNAHEARVPSKQGSTMASSLTKDSASTTGTEKTFLGHPRGLANLFMTEMWERYSFYGMRALLVLYLVAPASSGGLGFNMATATAI